MRLGDKNALRVFLRLADLGEGGLTTHASLLVMEKEKAAGPISHWSKAVRRAIESGRSFWSAAREEKSFDPATQGWIRAGENSGDLLSAFRDSAAYLQEKIAQKEKVAAALLYPCFLFFAAFGVFFFSSFFVIPQFNDLFTETGQTLPWITRGLFTAASWCHSVYFPVLLIFAVFLLSFTNLRSKLTSRLDSIVWGVEPAAHYARIFFMARWAPVMAGFIRRGQALPDAFQESIPLFSSKRIIQSLKEITARIREGMPLSSFGQEALFSPLSIEMFKTAEETGNFEPAFTTLARVYQKEKSDFLAAAIRILEPSLILLVGLFIGLLAIGLVLPIFEFNGGLG